MSHGGKHERVGRSWIPICPECEWRGVSREALCLSSDFWVAQYPGCKGSERTQERSSHILLWCLFSNSDNVSVSSGSYNKNAIDWGGGGLNSKWLFLIVLEAGKSKIKAPADLCLMRVGFLLHRPPSSHCILRCGKRARELSGCLLQGH